MINIGDDWEVSLFSYRFVDLWLESPLATLCYFVFVEDVAISNLFRLSIDSLKAGIRHTNCNYMNSHCIEIIF